MIIYNRILNLIGKNQRVRLVALLISTASISLVELIVAFSLPLYFTILVGQKTPVDMTVSKIFLHLGISQDLILILSYVLILLFSLKILLNLLHAFVLEKWLSSTATTVASQVFHKLLYMNYSNTQSISHAYVTQICTNEILRSMAFVWSFILLFKEGSLLVSIIIVSSLLTSPNILLIFLLLFCVGFLILKIQKKWSANQAQEGVRSRKKQIELINSEFGLRNEIRLYGIREYFAIKFKKHSSRIYNTEAKMRFYSQLPRHIIEYIVLTSIVFFGLFYFTASYESEYILSFFFIFVTLTLRAAPSISQVSALINNLRFYLPSLLEVINFLEPDKDYVQINDSNQAIRESKNSDNAIEFDNVSFGYERGEGLLRNLSFCIPAGKSVAIIGPSGCGKSTIIKLVLGQCKPELGSVAVNGVPVIKELTSGPYKVAYVPQEIYLLEGSLIENIGLRDITRCINAENVHQCIVQVSMKEVIESRVAKLDNEVIEGAKNFSGGQKQRLGVARGLYGEPDLLLLDEPTSAMDNTLERQVLTTLLDARKDKTTIVITHNKNNLDIFDMIIEIDRENFVIY